MQGSGPRDLRHAASLAVFLKVISTEIETPSLSCRMASRNGAICRRGCVVCPWKIFGRVFRCVLRLYLLQCKTR